jgi:hypothetical protein
MTHPRCSSCRARFSRQAGTALEACPLCGGPTDDLPPARLVGFRFVEADDRALSLQPAVAAQLPDPHPVRS